MVQRKYLTQRFPWLLPLRQWQRKLFFYGGMRFDGQHYARRQVEGDFPHEIFETKMLLLNEDTGFDLIYQENKVHNLRIAAQTMNHLVIAPGEVFSFWQLVRRAKDFGQYRDGLVVTNGVTHTESGGGLCLLSDLLFWLFLHGPFQIVERHGHTLKDFPDGDTGFPKGVDCTVAEGWLDLKMKNESAAHIQLQINFSDTHISGKLVSDAPFPYQIVIDNALVRLKKKADGTLEESVVEAIYTDTLSQRVVRRRKLYTNQCLLRYTLSEDEQKLSGMSAELS